MIEARGSFKSRASKTVHNSDGICRKLSRPKTRRRKQVFTAKREEHIAFWNQQKSFARAEHQEDVRHHLERLGIDICGIAGAWSYPSGEHEFGLQHPGSSHRPPCRLYWSGTTPSAAAAPPAAAPPPPPPAPDASTRSRHAAGHTAECGVGLVVRGTAYACQPKFRGISDRLCVARFPGSVTTSVIVAYAPHSGHPPAARQQFFASLQHAIDSISGMDNLILLGDFNSRVGSAATNADSYSGSLGRHGVGRRNVCGEELLRFTSRNQLAIANTFHQHKASHLYTHRNNRTPTRTGSYLGSAFPRQSCIDYIIVRRKWLSSVHDARVQQSANPGWLISDHHLLAARVRLHLKPPQQQWRQQPHLPVRYDRRALGDEETRAAYTAGVTARLATEPLWQTARTILAATSSQTPDQHTSTPNTTDTAAPSEASHRGDTAAAAARRFLHTLRLSPPQSTTPHHTTPRSPLPDTHTPSICRGTPTPPASTGGASTSRGNHRPRTPPHLSPAAARPGRGTAGWAIWRMRTPPPRPSISPSSCGARSSNGAGSQHSPPLPTNLFSYRPSPPPPPANGSQGTPPFWLHATPCPQQPTPSGTPPSQPPLTDTTQRPPPATTPSHRHGTLAEELHHLLVSAHMGTAEEELPTVQRHRQCPWMTDSTYLLITRRHEAREQVAVLHQRLHTLENRTQTRQTGAQVAALKGQISAAEAGVRVHRRDIQRAMRDDLRRHLTRVAERVAKAKGGAEFWREVNHARAPTTRPLRQCIVDATGSPQLGAGQKAAAFGQHFSGVLGTGRAVSEETLASIRCPPNLEVVPPPTAGEVADAVGRLRRGRATDADGLTAELLQAAGDGGADALHTVVLAAWQLGIPSALKCSVLLPLHKKGDRSLPANYRGIQIISIVRKVISNILSARITPWAEDKLLEYQCGFRPNRSCADQAFSLRHVIDMALQNLQRLHFCFVDLKQAFDSISRPGLWEVLRARQLPEELIRVLQDLHGDTSCRVRVGSAYSTSVDTPWGVQQGDPIAGLLFNIYIDFVLREALTAAETAAQEQGIQLGVQLRYTIRDTGRFWDPAEGPPLAQLTLHSALFADDIAAICESARGLALYMEHLGAACQRWGLAINTTKTECMVVDGRGRLTEDSALRATRCQSCGRMDGEPTMLLCDCCQQGWHMECLSPPLAAVPPGSWYCPECTDAAALVPDDSHPVSKEEPWAIVVSGERLSWVKEFKYLGSIISHDGSMDPELKRRSTLAVAAFHMLWGCIFKHRCISTGLKMWAYRAIVSQVLLYGAHCWALTAEQLQRLEVLQNHHLRRILGVRRSERFSIGELLQRCKQPTIQEQVRSRRGHWVGHMLRMGDNRLVKQVLFSSLLGRRRQGGQFQTILESYKADVRSVLSGSQCRNVAGAAKDKDIWNTLFVASRPVES